MSIQPREESVVSVLQLSSCHRLLRFRAPKTFGVSALYWRPDHARCRWPSDQQLPKLHPHPQPHCCLATIRELLSTLEVICLLFYYFFLSYNPICMKVYDHLE